ncbi:MAG: zinc ribbon domain-containing protein [Halobaculum sp.]
MAFSLRGNPVIAALLGLLVVGLGHCYLRRWLRGVGWAALVIAVGAAFVPDEALLALRAGDSVQPHLLAPVLTVVTLSAVDALAVALRSGDTSAAPDEHTCPECGETVDAGIDFCQWCTADLDREE